MYQTLDYGQKDRNISDKMLGREFDLAQRYQEQQAEQYYNRQVINNTFPMQDQERAYQEHILNERSRSFINNGNQPLAYSLTTQNKTNDVEYYWKYHLVVMTIIVILSLIIGILGLISLCRK